MSPTCSNSDSPSKAAARRASPRGWTSLAAWSLVLSVIWLGLLPRLASFPPLRQEIEAFEEQGIDPSAMFYTELDAMENIQRKLTKAHAEHGDAFWRP